MSNYTLEDELHALLELVKFKQFVRHGHALYVEYCGSLKPECTISELVWGSCKNPCFARYLIEDIQRYIPDFPRTLGCANRQISQLEPTFDHAMKRLRARDAAPLIAYSLESTNPYDHVYGNIRIQSGTEDDGHLWHGVLLPGDCWADNVEEVSVSIYTRSREPTLLWQHNFSGSGLAKKIKTHNDVVVFQPFKHPLPLLDLNITVVTHIAFKDVSHMIEETPHIFGVGSNAFCEWLKVAKFEVKLCKGNVARVNIRDEIITFV